MSKHPQQITTADAALDDDMKNRIIKYSITMGIRTLCFVAAYFMFKADLIILMWLCVAGAVILPYPAVIWANAGRERSNDDASALLDSAPLMQLPPAAGDTVTAEVIIDDGEVIDDEVREPDRDTVTFVVGEDVSEEHHRVRGASDSAAHADGPVRPDDSEDHLGDEEHHPNDSEHEHRV